MLQDITRLAYVICVRTYMVLLYRRLFLISILFFTPGAISLREFFCFLGIILRNAAAHLPLLEISKFSEAEE